MANVLITGGTGFVAHWLCETAPAGMFTLLLTHQEYDSGVIENITGIHAIIHLAPVAPYRVVEAAQRNNARLLYCSSGIVYHPEADTEYRRDKMNWEQYCLDSGVDVVIARLFTFCGEGLDDNKAIVQFEKAAKAGEPLRIWGDGSCVRSYMHGLELGRWMWAILLKGKSGEAYDVGSDEPITILELAKRYSDNIIIEGGKDAIPYYLPIDTAKTKALLDG